MFDFHNLRVYKEVKEFQQAVRKLLKDYRVDKIYEDQLKRASLSIVLNIAEGSGRFSKADKRYFYTMSRGSVYESVALIEILFEEALITQELYDKLAIELENISKMLLGLINSQHV